MIPSFDTARRMPAEIDLALLWSSLFLLMLGMVMVYSASIAIAEGGRFAGNNPAYFLVRHGVFLAIGLVAALVLGTLGAVAIRAGGLGVLRPADLAALWFTIWQAAVSAASAQKIFSASSATFLAAHLAAVAEASSARAAVRTCVMSWNSPLKKR